MTAEEGYGRAAPVQERADIEQGGSGVAGVVLLHAVPTTLRSSPLFPPLPHSLTHSSTRSAFLREPEEPETRDRIIDHPLG